MPGFNIGGFGGAQPSNTAEPRRVHRWIFKTLGRGNGQFTRLELLFLKSASRPKFKFEEAKLDHNQETAYFAGKQTWEPIELTWYDMEQNPDISRGVYAWLETVVQFKTANVGHPSTYKKTAQLVLLTGMAQVSELWTMYGTWPQDVDWKGLDYTSSEILTCVAKIRFDRALRSCDNNATPQQTNPECAVGLGTGTSQATGAAIGGLVGGVVGGALGI